MLGNTSAREDFESRISARSDENERAALPELPPPARLRASEGTGYVSLDWDAVQGAVGYLLHRRAVGHGSFEPVDHFGRDVLAIPDTWYIDTTGERDVLYDYAVASVPEVTAVGPLGDVVTAIARSASAVAPITTVDIDGKAAGSPIARPWLPMIGSERLSQLLHHDLCGGRDIGEEHLAALRRMHDEIGVTDVRAHAILHDDLGVYREVEGEPLHDFTRVDEVYDLLKGIGMRPTVELGFMPRDLASDLTKTAFEYCGYISPPNNEQRWADLITALVSHLVDRYGLDEVLGWDFEVWNEANLEVFWSGSRADWMRLYDVTAAAVRAVDPRLKVGGPSSAAAGWVDDLLAHTSVSGSPVDFVSTHVYGNAPLDLRPTLERYGYPDARILWTEWGVTPSHFNPVNDTVSSATFLLSGMRSAAGRVDALSYWVATDHFEELGRPPRMLHGGFGLISVGGIAKPRFHAMHMLSKLGDIELPAVVEGDGAGLVQAWASRHDDESITVLLWNHTLDQSKADGDAALDRRVTVRLTGVGAASTASVTRLDHGHGNLAALAAEVSVADWPTDEQFEALRAADSLTPEHVGLSKDGATTTISIDLPQPSAVLLHIRN